MTLRDAMVWTVLYVVTVSGFGVATYTKGLGEMTDVAERAIETATYYQVLADSAWTLVGERHGVASDAVRGCFAQ